MWKCPVCDQENTAAVCPRCGYDRTCDYERYPTAFAVTTAKPTSTLRRQWREKQEPTPEQWYARYQQEPDQAKWMECLKRSAEQGYAPAQAELGNCYYCGEGVEQDQALAAHWYCKAAEQGHADAQNSLGVCYENGIGVEKNAAQAVQWYRKAAQQGNAAAQFNLGLCYAKGEGVENNYDQAAQWFRKAAEQGFAEAQCWVGQCYYYGKGVKQDDTQAAEWYRKAAAQGDAMAQRRLEELKSQTPDRLSARYQQESDQTKRAESAPQPAQQAETQPVTVFLTLAEAAAGCRKTVSFKSGQDRIRLTLPIPAGVIYGEKLHYSLFNMHGGTQRDVIIEIRLCRSKILWNLFLHLVELATIAMGLSLWVLILSLVIEIFGGSFVSPADAQKMFLGSAACYAVFGGPILICESVYKKKYGPKTLAESVRCKSPLVIPLVLSDHT